MANNSASFGLEIDSTGSDRASASLDRMTASAKGATTASVGLEGQSTRLSQQLATLIRLEEEQTRILQQEAQGHRLAAQASEEHRSSLLHLTSAIAGVGGAYYLLHQHAQRARDSMQQAQQQMQQTIQTVGQLNAAITAHSMRPTPYDQSQQNHFWGDAYNTASLGALFGWGPLALPSAMLGRAAWNMAPSALRFAGRAGFGMSRGGFGLAGGIGSALWANPSLALTAGMGAAALWHATQPITGIGGNEGQLLNSLNDFSLRSMLTPGQIGSASAVGDASGIGSNATVALVQQMQQSMRGFTLQALDAQSALRELGVSTKEPVAAMRQALVALSHLPQSLARQELFHLVAGAGADPALLSPLNIEKLNPNPGTIGAYREGVQRRINEAQGQSAAMQEELETRAANMTSVGLGWGNGRFAFRLPSRQVIDRWIAEHGEHPRQTHAFATTLRQDSAEFWQSKEGPVGGGLLKGLTDPLGWDILKLQGKNLLGSLPFIGGSIEDPRELSKETQALTKRVRGQTAVFGEHSAGAAPHIITPGQFESLTQFEEGFGRFSPIRLQYLLKQEEQRAKSLQRQDDTAGRPLLSKADADRGLAAARLIYGRRSRPVNYELEVMQQEAQFAGMNPGEATIAQRVFQLNTMAQNVGNPNGMTPEQRRNAVTSVREAQQNAGGLRVQELGREVQELHDLGTAAKDGAGAMTGVKAVFEAHEEVIKGQITASQEASEKTLLLSQAFDTLRLSLEQMSRQSDQDLAEAKAEASAPTPAAAQRLRARYNTPIARALRAQGDITGANYGVGGAISGASNLSFDQLHHIAIQAANAYGVPVQPFLDQIGAESGFNPGARSPTGPIGIAQFSSRTARAYGVNPRDPTSSLYGAAHYMSDLHRRLGSWQRAVAGYVGGPGDLAGGMRQIDANPRYVRAFQGYGGSIGDLQQHDVSNADAQLQAERAAHLRDILATTGAATAASLGAPSGIAAPFAASGARAVVSGQISPGGQSSYERAQATDAVTQQLSALRAQNEERKKILQLQQQEAEAARQGPLAEKEIADQIQIENQYRQIQNTAIAFGTTALQKRVQQEKDVAEQQAASARGIEQTQMRNEAARNREISLTGTAAQYGAMQTGADALEKEKIVLQQVNAEKARGQKITAQELADIEKYAAATVHIQNQMQDYQRAQDQLKSTVSGAIDTAQQGIMGIAAPEGRTPIQRKMERIDALRSMGMGFINEGVNTFIKQPAENLLNNAISGRENTGIGIGTVIGNLLTGKKSPVDNSSLIDHAGGAGGLNGAASNLTSAANALKGAAAALGGGKAGSGDGTAKGGASDPYGGSGGSGGDLGNVVGGVTGAA